jgi:hypothetical protein
MIKSLHENHIRPVAGTHILIRHSQTTALLLGCILVALGANACLASPIDFHAKSAEEILLAQRAIADSVPMVTPPAAVNPTPSDADAVLESASPKSPGRAFLLNLLVPGAGHLYAGNKRGWVHLGLEGATWVTYLYYHDRGKTKENEFEGYADTHWDYQRWKAESMVGGDYTQESDALITDFMNTNRQQFYEDIGKLPIYWYGWDDYNPGVEDADSRRFYRGVRNDSNNFLKNARYAVVGGFVNRIVSAVDVLRLVKNRGRAKLDDDTSIKFNMRTRPFSNENALKITLTRRLD